DPDAAASRARIDVPPGRAHQHPSSVARAAAGDRTLWAPHVRFDPDAPYEVVVHDDGRHEVLLLALLPGQTTRIRTEVG
ncbi:hypothetical protein QR510_31035, partial [Escherichia coli]|uniref:hypothetical protein n=1 Tax=Escherichia coli TaxID=562 RepID=UPI00273A29AE